MTRLIGVTGLAGSGKGEIGRILTENHGFVESAFASPMRAIAEAVNPIVGVECPWDPTGCAGYCGDSDLITYNKAIDCYGYREAKERFPELRGFLQRLGTEGGRELFGEDHWINLWQKQNFKLDTSMVVTDVRFLNEAQRIRDLGGAVWRVSRPGVDTPMGHASETEMAKIRADVIVKNGKDLKHLETLVQQALDVTGLTVFTQLNTAPLEVSA